MAVKTCTVRHVRTSLRLSLACQPVILQLAMEDALQHIFKILDNIADAEADYELYHDKAQDIRKEANELYRQFREMERKANNAKERAAQLKLQLASYKEKVPSTPKKRKR